MCAAPISVTLSLGDVRYQAGLPDSLHRQGMLSRVLQFGANLRVLEANHDGELKPLRRFPAYTFANRVVWGVWRRLPGTGRSKLPQVVMARTADRLMAPYVTGNIFHGITTLSLACLQSAKRRGAVTLVENTVQHPVLWNRDVLDECVRFGIRPNQCDNVLSSAIIRRMQREYELCEHIIVLSSFARRGFQQFRGGDKAVVLFPGVDERLFPYAPQPPGIFRVLYAGRVEFAKGVQYLLEAWKKLGLPNAELVLVGEVRPEMRALLNQYASPSIKLEGRMTSEQLRDAYSCSTVFVLPSVNEGLARVMLEAMSSGLPVVATERAGAEDCVAEGKTGFIVPARNADALADAILWCYRHPDDARAMGQAGRQAVLQNFTIAHYEQRQIALYQSLAPRASSSSMSNATSTSSR
jgi:glycosyltransferase involved in cell wall biosynthesis